MNELIGGGRGGPEDGGATKGPEDTLEKGLSSPVDKFVLNSNPSIGGGGGGAEND